MSVGLCGWVSNRNWFTPLKRDSWWNKKCIEERVISPLYIFQNTKLVSTELIGLSTNSVGKLSTVTSWLGSSPNCLCSSPIAMLANTPGIATVGPNAIVSSKTFGTSTCQSVFGLYRLSSSTNAGAIANTIWISNSTKKTAAKATIGDAWGSSA